MRALALWSFLSFLALAPHSIYASVLAIDYGTDWIKASLMKPGVPFDVLLNKDSKRKIQASVAWKNSDRLFGSDAFNLASRFPSDSFSSLKLLQAAPRDAESVGFYTTISTSEVTETSRKTVALKRSDGTEWTTEELVAMQFAYVKQLAESLAGEKVHDVIVTVPPFYSQFERDAVADAIEIAGLRTLALINDGTAVAVNFAMTRTFPTPEYHVIYDAGASSIRATVVQMATGKDGKTSTPATQITVHGVGYDRRLGGAELDRRLREILINAFVTKNKRDIRGDKRGMAKMWKEAGRVKAILSANAEAMSMIESVAYDIDFRAKVTRAEFEDACADLQSRFAKPISEALANAGLTLDNITSVILTGGSTRTPMIQTAVKTFVGEEKISLNVNADEAAVLGAALHGASLSRQFKTKNIKVTDMTAHDIQASYFATSTTPLSRPRTISTLIFPAGSKTGTKKTLTLKRKEDFSLWLDYKQLVAPGFPMQILEAQISGVTEALQNLTDLGAVDPVVKATLSLSESGFVAVTDAVAYGEIKDDSIAGKLKGLFGGSSSSAQETETGSAENTPPRDTETPSESQSASSSSASPEASKVPEKIVPKENTIPLNVSVVFTSIPPMTVEEKKAARARLRDIDQQEAAKNRREEARNTFESYLYRVRDLLDNDDEESPFKKCSQASERSAMSDKLEESFLWLHDEGDNAKTTQFLEKRSSLETLERPIIHRYKEIEGFPKALNNSQMWNWSTRLFLTEAKTNLTAETAAGLPSKWTAEELAALEKTLIEHEKWLNEWVEKQKARKFNEDRVIETTEMRARAKVLEQHLQKLVRRKVPKVKKPKSTSTSATESATATPPEETPEAQEPPIEGEDAQKPVMEEEPPKPTGHDEL
ncbi:hypothetical protein HGRIS_006673 [Hohenbuehelia grisea]|uniref:Actin-like ATPase domain-containing protein n=1 Tax=Hohenbuehelia grisea TaxID=104357 RepID=A0ABR3JA85_9AGAR